MAERPMAEGVIRFRPDRRSLKQVEQQVGKTVGKIEQVASRGGLLGKSYTQPLGKITGAVGEFEKSLEASHARVVAFGASAGIIFAVTNAIQSMTRATIELEHRLAEINVILGASGTALKGFSEELFTVAKRTGQTFDAVSEAALEFARQGLAIEETLKRTRDAMILTRLSGLDVKSSVESITATMNSFNQTVIGSTTLINKLANVDAAFAVSSADLAHAIRRVGSSAQDAGLNIDELIAMVTTAQQVTARGGAVIGNSLKTIFTRLQRPQVLQDLGAFGVQIKNLQGDALPAIAVLKNFADTYQTLSAPQKAVAAEMVGGVFQVNVLKAAIGDLGKQFSIYDRALGISVTSTDQAIARNEQLNKTLQTLINESLVNLQKVGAAFANVTISPAIRNVLETLNEGLEGMSEKADSDSIGVRMGKGIMQGIGSILKGPGLILLAGLLSKLTYNFFQFSTDAVRTFAGLNGETQTQAEMQQLIQNLLLKNPDLIQAAMHSAEGLALVEKDILRVVQARNIALEQSVALSTKMTQGLTSGDLRSLNKSMEMMGGGGRTAGAWRPTSTAARGLVPNFTRQDEAAETIGAINAGYMPGQIKRMNVAGFGQVTYNDNEKVKQFPGMAQPAIMPPSRSDAGHAYKQKFKDKHGFDPYAFGGHVPNLAQTPKKGKSLSDFGAKRKSLWMERLRKLETHKADGKMESSMSMTDLATLLNFKNDKELSKSIPAAITANNRTSSHVQSTMQAFGYNKKTKNWDDKGGKRQYKRMRGLVGEVRGNLMGTNYITGLGSFFESEFADIMGTRRTGAGKPIDFVSLPKQGKGGMPRDAIKMMPKYTKGDTIWGQQGHGEVYMATKILAEKGINKDFGKEMKKPAHQRTFDFGSSRVVEILGAKDKEHFSGFRRKQMITKGHNIASSKRAYGPLRELAEDGNADATFRMGYRQDSVAVADVEEKWKKKWASKKTAAEGLVPNLATRILDRDHMSMVMGTKGRTKGLNEVWNEIIQKAAGAGKLSEVITGTPGIGKTTMAIDKAGGRNFISSPEELMSGDDLIVLRALTTNVSSDEFRHAKKITHLKAEKDVVMAMREKRRKEGKEGTSQTLFGRDPKATMGAEMTGVTTEAMLGETYPKKLTVLARQADMSLKELENAAGITTLDDASVTMGAFSPFTKGHQEMIQGGSGKTKVAFVSKGVDREGDIGLSISEKIKLMELADPELMAVSGAAGVQQIFEHKGQAYKLGKKREITLGSDRVFGTKAETQKFLQDREAFHAANGPRAKKSDSPAVAKKRIHFKDAMKDDVAQGFYTQGFDVSAIPRDPQGVSATKVRNAVLAGDTTKLKEYLPEASLPVIKNNLPKLQERARLIQQRKDNSQRILGELEIEKQAFDAEYGARKKKSEAAPVTDERKQLAARMVMYRKRLKSAGNSKIWAKLGLGMQFAEGLVPNLAYKGLHEKDLGQTLIPANPKDKVMTNVTEKQIQDKISQQILIRGPQDESLIVGTDLEGRTNRMVVGGMNARKIKKGNSKYKLLLDQVPDLFDGVAYELASVIGAKFDAEGATDAVAGRQFEKEFEATHGLEPAGAKAGSDYKVAEQIAQQLGTHKNLQLKLSTFERSKRNKNKVVNVASSFSKYLVDILTNNIKSYGLSSVTTPDKFQRAMQTLEANPALKEDWAGYMGQAGFMSDGLVPNFLEGREVGRKNTKRRNELGDRRFNAHETPSNAAWDKDAFASLKGGTHWTNTSPPKFTKSGETFSKKAGLTKGTTVLADNGKLHLSNLAFHAATATRAGMRGDEKFPDGSEYLAGGFFNVDKGILNYDESHNLTAAALEKAKGMAFSKGHVPNFGAPTDWRRSQGGKWTRDESRGEARVAKLPYLEEKDFSDLMKAVRSASHKSIGSVTYQKGAGLRFNNGANEFDVNEALTRAGRSDLVEKLNLRSDFAAAGGLIPKYHTGGVVPNFNKEQLAVLRGGEGVVNQEGMEKLGQEGLQTLNKGLVPNLAMTMPRGVGGLRRALRPGAQKEIDINSIEELTGRGVSLSQATQINDKQNMIAGKGSLGMLSGAKEMDFDVSKEEEALVTHKNTRIDRVISFLEAMRMVDPAFDRSDVFKRVGFNSNDRAFEEAFGGDKLQFFFATPPSDKLDETMSDLAGKNAHELVGRKTKTGTEIMRADMGFGSKKGKDRDYETGAAAHVGHYGSAASAFSNPADAKTGALGSARAATEKDEWEDQQWEKAQNQASNSVIRARNIIRAGMVARGLRFQDVDEQGRRAQGGIATKQMGEDYEAGQYYTRSDKKKDNLGQGVIDEKMDWLRQEEDKIRKLPAIEQSAEMDKLKASRRGVWEERIKESVDEPLVGDMISESVTKEAFDERMNLAANQVIAQRLESSMGTRNMPTQYVAGYSKQILDKVLAARQDTGGLGAGMEIMTQGVTSNDIESIVPYIKMKAQSKVEGNKAVMGYLRRQANSLRAGFEDYHALMSKEASLEAATRQEAAKKGQKGHVQHEGGKAEYNINKDGKVVTERVDLKGEKVNHAKTVTIGTEKKFLKDAEGFRSGVSYEVGHELKGIEGAQRPPTTIPEPHVVEGALKWQTGGWDARDLELIASMNYKSALDPRLNDRYDLDDTHQKLSAFHREAKALGFKDIDGSPLWDDFWAKQPTPVGFSNLPADVFDPSGTKEALWKQESEARQVSIAASITRMRQDKAAYAGSVPNFNREALTDAVKREKDAGYASNQVKVGFDSRLKESGGVGVYNTTEGSLSRAINMHAAQGKTMSQLQSQGASSGRVPNFNAGMDGAMLAMGIGMLVPQMLQLRKGLGDLFGESDAFKAALKQATEAVGEAELAEKAKTQSIEETIAAAGKGVEEAGKDVGRSKEQERDTKTERATLGSQIPELEKGARESEARAQQAGLDAALATPERRATLEAQQTDVNQQLLTAQIDETDALAAVGKMGTPKGRRKRQRQADEAGGVRAAAEAQKARIEAELEALKYAKENAEALKAEAEERRRLAETIKGRKKQADINLEEQKKNTARLEGRDQKAKNRKAAAGRLGVEKQQEAVQAAKQKVVDVREGERGQMWSDRDTQKQKGIGGAINRARGKGGKLDSFLKGSGAGLAFAAPMMASQASSMLDLKGGAKAGVESAGQGIGTAVAMGTMLGPVGLIGGLAMGANNLGKALAKAEIKKKLDGVSKEFDLISDKLGKVTSGGQAYMENLDKLNSAMNDSTGKVKPEDVARIKTQMAKALGDVPAEFQSKFAAAAGDAEKIKQVFSEITEELTSVKNDLQAAKTGFEMQEKFAAGGGFFNVDETLFEKNEKGALTPEGKRLSAQADAQVALSANRSKLLEGMKGGTVSSKNFSLQNSKDAEMFGPQFQNFVETLKDPKDIAEYEKKIKEFLGRMEEGIKVTDEAESALKKKIATDEAYNRVLKKLSADIATFGSTIGKITSRITSRIDTLAKMSDRVKEFSLNMALAGQKGANKLGEPFRHKKDQAESDLSVKIAEINKKTITDSRKILGENAKANLDAVIGEFTKISGTVEKQASDLSGKQNRELLTALERNQQAQQAMVPIVEEALMAQAEDPSDPESMKPILAKMAGVLERNGIDGQRAEANRDLLIEITKSNGATTQNKLAELIQTQQHQIELEKEQTYWAARSADLQERIASFGGMGQFMTGTGGESKGIADLGSVLDEMILGSVSTSIEGMGRANLKLLDTLINKMNFDEMSKNIKALAPLLSTAIAARATDIQNQVGAATRMTKILDPTLANVIPEVDAEKLATEQVASQLKLDQMPDDVAAIKENTALTNLLLQHQAEEITSKNKESFSEALRMNGIPQNMMQSAIAGNLTADSTKALGVTNAAGFNLMLGPSREIQQTLSTIQSNLPNDLITAQTPVLAQISENLSNALVNKLSNFQSQVVVKDFSKVVEQRQQALNNIKALSEARELATAVAQAQANYDATEGTRKEQAEIENRTKGAIASGFKTDTHLDFGGTIQEIVGLTGGLDSFPDQKVNPDMYTSGKGWGDGPWEGTGKNLSAMMATMTTYWAEGREKGSGGATMTSSERMDRELGRIESLATMFERFERLALGPSGFGEKDTSGLGKFEVKNEDEDNVKLELNAALKEVFFKWARSGVNADFEDDEAAAMRKEVNALLTEASRRRTKQSQDSLGNSKEQWVKLQAAIKALDDKRSGLESQGIIFEPDKVPMEVQAAVSPGGQQAQGDAAGTAREVSIMAPRFESRDDKVTSELITEMNKMHSTLLQGYQAARDAMGTGNLTNEARDQAAEKLAEEFKKAAKIAEKAGLTFGKDTGKFERPTAKSGATKGVKTAGQITADQKKDEEKRNKKAAREELGKPLPPTPEDAEFDPGGGDGRTGITAPKGAQVHAIQKSISELIHGHIKSYKEALDKGAAGGGMEFTDLKTRLGSAKKESSVMGQLASLEEEKAGVMAEIERYSEGGRDASEDGAAASVKDLQNQKAGLEAKERLLKSEEEALNFVIAHGSEEAKRQALLKKLNLKNIDINYVISRNLKQTGRLEKLLEEYGDMQAKLASGRLSAAIANALKSTKDMGGSKAVVEKGMAEFQQAIMGSIGFTDLKEKVGRGRASTLQSKIRDKQELFIRNQAQGIMDGLDKLSGDKKVVNLLKQRKLDITDMMRHEVEEWALANQGELINILKDANFDSGKIEALRKGIYFMDELTAKQIILSHTMKESNMAYDHMLDLFDKGGATFEDLTSAFEEMKKASKAQGRLVDERKIREQLRRTAQSTADDFGQTLNEAFNGLARSSDMQNAMDTALKELIENPQAFKAQIKDLLPTDQSELIKGQYDKAGMAPTPIDGARLFQKMENVLTELRNIDGRLHGSPNIATTALRSLVVLNNVRRAAASVMGSQKLANVHLAGIQRELAKSPLERLLSSSLGDIAKALNKDKKTPEEGDEETELKKHEEGSEPPKDNPPVVPPAISAQSVTDNLVDYLKSTKGDDKENLNALIKAIEKMTPEQAYRALNSPDTTQDEKLNQLLGATSDAQRDLFEKIFKKSEQFKESKRNDPPRPTTVVKPDGGGATGQGDAGGAGDLAAKAETAARAKAGLDIVEFGSKLSSVNGVLGSLMTSIGKWIGGKASQKLREAKDAVSTAQLAADNKSSPKDKEEAEKRRLMNMRIPLATDQKTQTIRQVQDIVHMARMNAKGTNMKDSFDIRRERFKSQLNDANRSPDEKKALHLRLQDLATKRKESFESNRGQAIANLGGMDNLPKKKKQREALIDKEMVQLFGKQQLGGKMQEMEQLTGVIDALGEMDPKAMLTISPEEIDARIEAARDAMHKIGEIIPQEEAVKLIQHKMARVRKGLELAIEELGLGIGDETKVIAGRDSTQQDFVKRFGRRDKKTGKLLGFKNEAGEELTGEAATKFIAGKVKAADVALANDYNLSFQAQHELFKEGVGTTEEMTAALSKYIDQTIRAGEYSGEEFKKSFRNGFTFTSKQLDQRFADFAANFGKDFKSEISSAFSAAIKGTKDFKEAMSDAFGNLADKILDRSIETAVDAGLSFIGLNSGGLVKGYSSGGSVIGGSGVKDDVPAYLSKGEYVIKRSAVGQYGKEFFDSLNNSNVVMAAGGGSMGGSNKAVHTKVIQGLSDQETKARNLRRNMSEAGLVAYGYKVKSDRKKEDWLGRETGDYETDSKVGYRLDLSSPLTPERLDKIKKLAKSNAEIAKHIDQDIFSRSVYQVNEKGAKIQLDNKFVYDDVKRPDKGQWMQDARLSSLALTDENNPQNKYKFEKSEAFFGYQKDKMDFMRDQAEEVEKWQQQKKNRRTEWMFGAGTMLFTGAAMGKFASGGRSPDDIPALLTGGEYVVRKGMVDKYGLQFFENLNRGQINTFNKGGYVTPGSTTGRTGTDVEALGMFGNEGMTGGHGETNNNISIVVNIDNDGGVTTEQGDREGTSSSTTTEDGRKLGERVKAAVIDVIVQEKRPGGMLYN